MKLIEPTMEYDREIQAFRSEFLHPGMSMDGGGSLIRFANTAEWLERVEAFRRPETVPETAPPSVTKTRAAKSPFRNAVSYKYPASVFRNPKASMVSGTKRFL